jgi:hypothetical protein
MTLREARANFEAFGACNKASLRHVLPEQERSAFSRVSRRL